MDKFTALGLMKKFPVIIKILNQEIHLPQSLGQIIPDIQGLSSISATAFDPDIFEFCPPEGEILIIVTKDEILFNTTDSQITFGDFVLKWLGPIEENHEVFSRISHLVHLKSDPEFKFVLIHLPPGTIQNYLKERKNLADEQLDGLLGYDGAF